MNMDPSRTSLVSLEGALPARSTESYLQQRIYKFFISLPLLYLFILLVVIATTRQWLLTRDTEQYLDFFNNFSIYAGQIEPGFALLAAMVKTIGGKELSFLFASAFLGIGLKYFNILRYARFIWLSIFIYLVKFYFLHDLVQIRVGIAVGIVLLGIRYVIERKALAFILIVLTATCFHYSAFVYVVLYPLGSKNFSSKKLVIIELMTLLLFIGFNLDDRFLSSMAAQFPRLELYFELQQLGEHAEIHLFNLETITRLCMFLILFLNQRRIERRIPYFHLWLRMLSVGLLFYFLFRQLPVVAFRISELFDVAMIFAYPSIILLFRNRIYGYMALALVSMVYLIGLRSLQGYF